MDMPLREPGFWESLRELLLGSRRMFDCVQVEVSSRCRGRCSYCPRAVFADRWRGRDIDMETFRRLWPLLRQTARVHLQGWGEPLLNPLFFELAALGRKAGCSVSTTTCGSELNDQVARDLVGSGIDIVAFSLAGAEPAANACRRGVSFEKVCASIERLQAIRRAAGAVHLEIHFAYMMLASQIEAVRNLPGLMRRLGVHAAVVSTLDYLPHTDLEEEAIHPGTPERLIRARQVLFETAQEALRLGLDFHFHLAGQEPRPAGCSENIGRSVFVSADGSISPCVYTNIPSDAADANRRTFGDLSGDDPLKLWNSPPYQDFRRNLAIGQPDPVCRSCPKRFIA